MLTIRENYYAIEQKCCHKQAFKTINRTSKQTIIRSLLKEKRSRWCPTAEAACHHLGSSPYAPLASSGLPLYPHRNRVGGKRSSLIPTFVFRPLTPPYVRFRIRRFFILRASPSDKDNQRRGVYYWSRRGALYLPRLPNIPCCCCRRFLPNMA